MKFFLVVFSGLILTLSCDALEYVEGIEVPPEFKAIEEDIFNKLVVPDDGQVQRDIKSLFAQYILLAAMDAANETTSNEVKPVAPSSVASHNPVPVSVPSPQQHVQQAPAPSQPQPQVTSAPSRQEPVAAVTSGPIQVPAPAPTTVPVLIPAPTDPTSVSGAQLQPHPSAEGATQPPPAPALPLPTLRPRPSTEHVLNQVDKILVNVAKGNVTGIVDQSLQINSSKPVQNLVTGILNTIFCTPINRLLGRCRGRVLHY